MKYRHKLKIKRSWTSALVISPLSLSAKVKGFGEVVVIWKSETKLTFEAIQVFKSKNLKLNSSFGEIYACKNEKLNSTFEEILVFKIVVF